jgi:hypothetical protein
LKEAETHKFGSKNGLDLGLWWPPSDRGPCRLATILLLALPVAMEDSPACQVGRHYYESRAVTDSTLNDSILNEHSSMITSSFSSLSSIWKQADSK